MHHMECCVHSRDVSSMSTLLPPKSAVVKVKTLDSTELESLLPGATHLLVTSPTTAQVYDGGDMICMELPTCAGLHASTNLFTPLHHPTTTMAK